MTGIFTLIDDFINKQMHQVVKVTQTNIAESVNDILSVSIILYVIVYGYMILAEKVNVPVKSLLWQLASFAIIIAFMQNADGLLTLATEAVEELSTIGSGGNTGLQFLDDQYIRVSIFANTLWSNGNILTGTIGYITAMLSWGVCTIPVFSIFIISKFTMFLLLGFAPLFIFCLMWGWLKQSFNNYLTALLSNAFIIIVIRTIQKSIVEFFDKFTSPTEDVNPALIGILMLAVSIVLWKLYIYIIMTVSKLMTTTVDQFPVGKSSDSSDVKKEAAQRVAQERRDQVQERILHQLEKLNRK